ncbi:MAG: hypothetical protein ACW981_13560 [Candidatus Hodarchaeales archaeon]
MRKTKIMIFIIFNILIGSVLTINAQGNYLYASWSDHDIVLESDFENWTDALGHSVPSLQSQIYLKNTKNYFYIAIFHYSNFVISNVSVTLDTNHDLILADDMKLVTSSNIDKDYYFTSVNSLLEDTNKDFDARFDNDFVLAGTSGSFTEFKIPLIPPASQILIDLVVIDPSDYLVGFDIAFGLNNGSYYTISQGMASSNNGDASNYLTVILAPPGRFKTPDFSPPTSFVPSTTSSSSTITDDGYKPGDEYSSTETLAAGAGFTVMDTVFILVGTIALFLTLKRRGSK